jgi:MoaA/NifB/PqqE/SkfB family radical SAM enzyme
VRLHTNATLLDQELARRLLAAPPDLLTVSLDTLDPADYALARPGAELGRTLANLEGLLRLRRQAGGGKPRISLLLMGRQRGGEEAGARLERLKSLGLERVVWRAPHNWGGSVAGPGQGGAAPRRPAVCTFPWYGLAVLSDGRVTPCPQDFLGGVALGEMAPGRSLEEIWRGQALGGLRRDLAARRLEQRPVCLACDRIRRPTLLGLPTEHLKNLLVESIVEPRGGAKGSLGRRRD